MGSAPNDPPVFVVKLAVRIGGFCLLWVLFALVRRLFRSRLGGGLTDEEIAALRRKIRHYDTPAVVIGLLIGGAVGFGLWAGCHYAAAAHARAMPPHVFLYRTTGGVGSPDWLWVIPAGIMGVVAAAWGHVLGVRLLFGRTGLLAWQVVTNARYRLDQRRLNMVITALAVPGSLILALLLLDMYTRVEEDRFVVNSVWSLEEESRPYTDVTAIVVTTHVRDRKGKESYAPKLHVVFADGSEWYAYPPQDYVPLIEFLERKTGKRLQQVRHVEDLAAR